MSNKFEEWLEENLQKGCYWNASEWHHIFSLFTNDATRSSCIDKLAEALATAPHKIGCADIVSLIACTTNDSCKASMTECLAPFVFDPEHKNSVIAVFSSNRAVQMSVEDYPFGQRS